MSRFLSACDSCGARFLIDSVAIRVTELDLDEGQCEVAYFACPSCRRVYLVFVKDARYMELKEDMDNHSRRMQKLRGRVSAEEANNLSVMFGRKRDRLSRHVDFLKKKYDGRFTLVETENGTEDLKLLP